MTIDRRYITDVFSDIVDIVKTKYDTIDGEKPYFLYGHPVDITNQLSIKDESSVERYKKYPLICLLLDVKENHNVNLNFQYSCSPQILILTETDPAYISSQRTISTFKPILYPLYFNLLEAMEESGHVFYDFSGIDHEMTPHYFWGKEGIKMRGYDGLIFNEYLDGIQVDFNNLKIFKNNCII